MIPLILPTCSRLSTPKNASAGPDAWSLLYISHICMLPLSPHPSAFAFVSSVSYSSAFLSSSLFCASSRGNLRCQLSVLLMCVTRVFMMQTKYAATGRGKEDKAFLGSDLRSGVYLWAFECTSTLKRSGMISWPRGLSLALVKWTPHLWGQTVVTVRMRTRNS